MALSSGYYQYMNSEEWYRKRERWLRLADYECEWCSKFGCTLYVHHLTYKNFMHEKDDDVVVVCKACHKHGDIIRKIVKKHGHEPLIQHILKKRGYPFNMKLRSRKHVIKLKRDLQKAVKILKTVNNLNQKDTQALQDYLKEAKF